MGGACSMHAEIVKLVRKSEGKHRWRYLDVRRDGDT